MTLGPLIVVLAPAALWLMVLTTRTWRHPRLLSAMFIWTVAWIGAAVLLPAASARIARLVLAVAILPVGVWPARLGLLSIRGAEVEADRIFRRVSGWLREEGRSREAAVSFVSELARETFPVKSGDWAVAASLFRRSVLRRTGAVASTLTSVTAYERAARSFWRAALDRRLIGSRHRPDAWDEGVALRCCFEEFTAVVPNDALSDQPVVALGGWDEEAARVIQAVGETPIGDPITSRVRDALMAAMEDQLTVARGERSNEAKARQRASAALLAEEWAALASREGEALVQHEGKHPASPT